jgi:hypothetical protein
MTSLRGLTEPNQDHQIFFYMPVFFFFFGSVNFFFRVGFRLCVNGTGCLIECGSGVSTLELCLKEKGHDRRQYIIGEPWKRVSFEKFQIPAVLTSCTHHHPHKRCNTWSYPIRLKHCRRGAGCAHSLGTSGYCEKKMGGAVTSSD